MMKTTMIVVADSASARILTTESTHSPLNEIEVLAHPEARLHGRDLTSDLPGKTAGRDSSTGHAYESRTDPKKHELTEFARQVAGYLDRACNANKISNLLLVASPVFLGELRAQLSGKVSEKIIFELDKNLVQLSIEEISQHLPGAFRM